MPSASLSLVSIFAISFCLCQTGLSSSLVRMEKGSSQVWCVAKNNAEDGALQKGLDWVCGLGGADCGPIQQGGSCFEPTDIQSHASFAFNDYFLKNALNNPQPCDFGSAAALTTLNPSHGKCVFPSSSLARNGSFTGLATATDPSEAVSSAGYTAYSWGWSLVTTPMMLMTALVL